MPLEIKTDMENMVIRNQGHVPAISFIDNNSGFHEIRDRDVLSFHSRKIEIKGDGNNTIISISIET